MEYSTPSLMEIHNEKILLITYRVAAFCYKFSVNADTTAVLKVTGQLDCWRL